MSIRPTPGATDSAPFDEPADSTAQPDPTALHDALELPSAFRSKPKTPITLQIQERNSWEAIAVSVRNAWEV